MSKNLVQFWQKLPWNRLEKHCTLLNRLLTDYQGRGATEYELTQSLGSSMTREEIHQIVMDLYIYDFLVAQRQGPEHKYYVTVPLGIELLQAYRQYRPNSVIEVDFVEKSKKSA